jgi:hypothetical protein
MSRRLSLLSAICAALCFVSPSRAQTSDGGQGPSALLAAYPGFLDRIEGGELIWKDGSRMKIDDGRGAKDFETLLNEPDIKDMFAMPYPLGESRTPPAGNFDPGRIRYAPLFEKMYGDCQKGRVLDKAVDVVWLPTKYGKKLKFSKVNGAAAALQAVSNELDKLPDSFLDDLRPPAGTYNCRVIAGTRRLSAHGLAIAIDISTRRAHYWRSAKPDANNNYVYQNKIPWEIVRIFEKHGFIWGGKWHHYDTMHFEYRPELTGHHP